MLLRYLLAVCATAALAACYDPGARCGDGYCPSGTECSTGDVCVFPEQRTSCAASADGAACDVRGRPGVCHAGVCLLVTCGDGVAEGDEPCDGADLRGATCQASGYYGGGVPTCSATCRLEMATCGGRCGDGVVQGELEACDGDTAGRTCVGEGFYGGALTCRDCQLDTSACEGRCGDGFVTLGEACDGTNFAGQSCTDRGFYGGALGCSADCRTIDTTACAGRCGDGVKNGPEICDGADLAGLSCQTYGWYGGALACGDDCVSVNPAACTEYCGDGVKNGNELCDGLDHDDISCTSIGAMAGALGCNAYCQQTTEACYWSSLRPVVRGPSGVMSAAWGTSDRDLWASSDTVYLSHFDGKRWTSVDAGLQSAVFKFWGSGVGDLWALTNGGQLAHYDGASWSVAHEGLSRTVAATTRSNVWVIPRSGVARHFDGAMWRDVTVPISFRAVATLEQGTAWFATEVGALHYDGVTWTLHDVHGSPDSCFWGTSDNDVFTLSSTDSASKLLHYDGAAWTSRDLPNRFMGQCGWTDSTGRNWIYGTVEAQRPFVVLVDNDTVWPIATGFIHWWQNWASDGFLWTTDGERILRLDGPSWAQRRVASDSEPTAIHVLSSTSAWVGSLRDAEFISPDAPIEPYPTGGNVFSIYTTPLTTWIAGHFDILRYADGSFQRQDGPDLVNALWGLADDDMWAISRDQILHFDGNDWLVEATFPAAGAAWLVGSDESNRWALYNDRVYRPEGNGWTPFVPAATAPPISSITTTTGSDVWFFDYSGNAYQHDGETAWRHRGTWVSSVGNSWSESPRSVWAFEGSGLHRFDGVAWSRVRLPPDALVTNLHGAAGTVWVTSLEGDVYNLPTVVGRRNGAACTSAFPVYCNVALRGHTAQTVDGPTDCNDAAHPGGELHYRIEVPVTGRLTARVTSRFEVDLAAVRADDRGGCEVASCVGERPSSTEVVLDVAQGDTLYLVVGAAGDAAPFTLDVACEKH